VRALVTGGTGVLGRALVAALHERGDDVVVLARGEEADVRGDVCDPALVARATRGAEVVFHLAGDALGGSAVNVAGTRAVLEAGAGAARVVVASTLAVHGAADGALTETTPLAPVTPYATTKAEADALARAHGAVVARLANVYGPDDRHASRLVPELLAAAREDRPPRMRSGAATARDLLHADDAARALLALADGGLPGEAYNIGSGAATSLAQAVAAMERVLGRPLHAAFPPGDHGVRWADTTKIAAATGWRATTSLEDGLRALRAQAA
jgi:nucleoside-diphosphate-sugar epimerase